MQPTDRQLHHLLQRYAPLSTCWRTRRAVAARLGISETGFRCRMATTVNLYGRNEFRKQPELVNVAEIVRELAEIQIETDPALAA